MALALCWNGHGGGVTLITHGNGGTTIGQMSWVSGMATNAFSPRLGGNVPVYRLSVANGLVTSVTKVAGGDPLALPSGEVIVMLDWGPVSSGAATTYQVAATVAPLFSQTDFIAELGGHALAELPLHLIGHSRGGSLVCDLSRRLGEQGLWVDQVTSLDAYPLGDDAPAVTHENVLFADCINQTAPLSLIKGQVVPNTFWRKQTTVSGGYSFPYDGHSDVHLWYHGTIALATPASDTEESITASMRTSWWTTSEQQGTNAGFFYTRNGSGSRLSTDQPNGTDSTQVRAGFHQYHDLGLGLGSNRTPLTNNAGLWPNPIRLTLLSTNVLEHGEAASLRLYFQWAAPITSTQTVEVLADPDLNPFNGNETLLTNGTASGTTELDVPHGTLSVPIDGAVLAPGAYRLMVRMTGGGRSRSLHTSETIQVLPGMQPLWLDIVQLSETEMEIGVNGSPGQAVVLERADEALVWTPMATNTLGSSRWAVTNALESDAVLRLYRARQVGP